jgi:hypothetical protein
VASPYSLRAANGIKGATTLSITTFSIITFSIITFSIITFSIITFSIMTQHKRLICDTQHI